MTLLSGIPVLRSGDYPRAKAFWTEKLGFSVVEEGGEPAGFGIFRQGKATVFIEAWHGADPEPSPGWRAYFHCADVDDLLADLRDKGVDVNGPEDTSYGMREISLRDPDGNLLCFGQDRQTP